MKKFLLSVFCLLLSSSVLCAGKLEKVLTGGERGAVMARKSMSTLRITPGFRTEKQPEIPQEFMSHRLFPRNVKFLDRDILSL